MEIEQMPFEIGPSKGGCDKSHKDWKGREDQHVPLFCVPLLCVLPNMFNIPCLWIGSPLFNDEILKQSTFKH